MATRNEVTLSDDAENEAKTLNVRDEDHPDPSNVVTSPIVNGASRQEDGSTKITFRDVVYTVQIKDKCCSSLPKTILKDVSGILKPGLNAIMGATGSGKTSLLDVIAARKDPAGLKGTILLNGKKRPPNFRLMTGYVVQDDVVMGTLSVKENFMFSANLRLPRSVSTADKKERVASIVNELGLSHVADMKVGTEFIRGISGGERKRTNIGMELIISPKVLFLDEPTTGLDASTANAVLLLLHRLGRQGKVIVLSIHQPRYSIYKLFDHLILLAGGHLVYQGPGHEAVDYFSSIGHVCETHNNPADFFLDVINGDSTAVQLTSDNYDTVDLQAVTVDESTGTEDALALDLNKKYKQSKLYFNLMEQIDATSSNLSGAETEVVGETNQYVTSFFTQVAVLSGRTLKNIVRNPQTSIMQNMVMVVFGVLVGLVYYQMDLTTAGLTNRSGAFFFIVMNQVFANMSAVELFIRERKIFIHENANGFYRVSAYFISKLFCDVVPMRFVPNIGFCLIVYFMTGLQIHPAKFFIFFLTLSCTSLAASALGFFFSAIVRVFALANLLIALSYVFMMVFSGFLVRLDSLLIFLQWIKWFSIFRYGFNTLSINELTGLKFCDTIPNTNMTHCITGEEGLDQMKIPHGTEWDLWVNIVALGSMSAILLTFTYIQLRRVNKYT